MSGSGRRSRSRSKERREKNQERMEEKQRNTRKIIPIHENERI